MSILGGSSALFDCDIKLARYCRTGLTMLIGRYQAEQAALRRRAQVRELGFERIDVVKQVAPVLVLDAVHVLVAQVLKSFVRGRFHRLALRSSFTAFRMFRSTPSAYSGTA
jgi:hypothetical protein